MSNELVISKMGASDEVALALEEAMIAGGMVCTLEKAHFIAQLAHESNFKLVREDLSYSAKRLREVFGKYFVNDASAAKYARKPQAIANRVYANRMGNGPEASGDGWKNRGGGFIQLTGANNYTKASKDLFGNTCLSDNPDLILDPDTGAKAAVWFWYDRNCNFPALRDEIEAVTRKINGGINGLEDRIEKLKKVKRIFNLL